MMPNRSSNATRTLAQPKPSSAVSASTKGGISGGAFSSGVSSKTPTSTPTSTRKQKQVSLGLYTCLLCECFLNHTDRFYVMPLSFVVIIVTNGDNNE
jgi:hypothetical protein